MQTRVTAAVLLLLFGACTARASQTSLEYTLLSRSAGPLRSVAVSGNYAFAGVGHQLWVFDITDKQNPALVFESEALPTTIEKVAIKNEYVFIAAGRPSAISLVLKIAMFVSGFCCRSEIIRFGAVLPTVESGMST